MADTTDFKAAWSQGGQGGAHVSGSISRMVLLAVAVLSLLALFVALLAGLARWGDTLREQHCDRFSGTHARIEAAQRGEPYQAVDGEGDDACIHVDERAAKAGGGA